MTEKKTKKIFDDPFYTIILPIKINENQQKIIDKIPKNEDENFVPVQCGYDNYYVSDQGKLWNNDTKKFLKGTRDEKKGLNINFKKDKKSRKIFIHRLIAFHFISNPNKYEHIKHFNNNKFDNKISNLYWDSSSDLDVKNIKPITIDDIEKLEGEIFVPIKNTKHGAYLEYQISNMGRLWSDKTRKICKGTISKMSGYVYISLTKDNKDIYHLCHQIVALQFHKNSENKPQVNHINGIKTDNRAINLEWVTSKENNIHSSKYIKKTKGKSVQKLHPQTLEILAEYPSRAKTKEDGFTPRSVCDAIKNHTLHKDFYWKNKEDEPPEEIIEGEIWVSLKDSIYDEVNIFDKYQVSDYGRIRGHIGRILKPTGTSITLCNDTVQYPIYIHKLILLAFNVENPENKDTVDHIDSNHMNNKLTNLRFATRKEQMQNEETLKKLRKENYNTRKTIRVTNNITNMTKIYKGYIEAENEIKVSHKTIKKYAELNKIYKKKYKNQIKNYKFEIL